MSKGQTLVLENLKNRNKGIRWPRDICGLRWTLPDADLSLKLTSLLSSSIFILIIYCVLERRAPNGNRCNHAPKSMLLCKIGDCSFEIYLVHMMFLYPYPITSLIVLSVSLIFCYACTAVMGKRAGRWLGLI